MKQEDLEKIIESHGRWIVGKNDGERANLRGVDLSGVDLSDADLRNADLRGANLSGANLPKTILQVGPIGSRRDYTLYNATSNVVQCGCWNDGIGGTLEEFRERINEVYPEEKERTLKYRREYLAVIAYFETVRALEKEEQK